MVVRAGDEHARDVLIVDIGGALGRMRLDFGATLRMQFVSSVLDGLARTALLQPRVIVLALAADDPNECEHVRLLRTRAPALLLVAQSTDEARITRLVKEPFDDVTVAREALRSVAPA